MFLRACELRSKDVVSVKTGCRLGTVGDFEIDLSTAQITALIIFGRFRCFGFLGRQKDIIIRWCDIALIGEDTILVRCDTPIRKKRRNR
ncbi:MAG: YlmC/YmxH family sporulation protein [Oscillospiraceae bacterium]